MAQAISVSVLIPSLRLPVASMRNSLLGVTKQPFCAIFFRCRSSTLGKGRIYMRARRVRMSRRRGMPYHEFSRASRGLAYGPWGPGHSANPCSRTVHARTSDHGFPGQPDCRRVPGSGDDKAAVWLCEPVPGAR